MSNIFILNAHHPYPFAQGKLNASLVELATEQLIKQGHQVRTTAMSNTWDVGEELDKHTWADCIILQSPVNWMGVPWIFKQYMDEVYTAGMDGTLCDGDGRTAQNPKQNYGAGGTLANKEYMLSLTFNAPAEAFNDPDEYLFAGKGVDDLFFPMHMNFKFFGMRALPTFACFDVMKNAQIERDMRRFSEHLSAHF